MFLVSPQLEAEKKRVPRDLVMVLATSSSMSESKMQQAKKALTDPLPGGRVEVRVSPPGYSMDFHPTTTPQWTFVLSGALEIGLPDGSSRVFRPGDHLYSTDTVPAGVTFDPKVHGHNSRQVGDEPLVTALVRG